MAPRSLTDVEIMQKFIETSEIIAEMRVATARIEEKVDTLVSAQSRCQDHASRLRDVEVQTGKLEQNFRNGAWVVGVLLALVGVINVPIIYFSVRWWNTLHQGASITVTGAPNTPPAQVRRVTAPTVPVVAVVVTTVWRATSMPGSEPAPSVSVQPVPGLSSVSKPIATVVVAAWTAAAAQASNPPSTGVAIDRGNRRENGSWDMAGSEVTDRQDPPIVGAPPVRHT